jgi:xylulokinase
VFWSKNAEQMLSSLNVEKSLVQQLSPKAFAHPFSPNWQDASTQVECDAFDTALGGPEQLATLTGSKAHHRFSGPQIMRFKKKFPDRYQQTGRISLVSSFLASVLAGTIAPIDRADVGGMNLFEMEQNEWSQALLKLTSGSKESAVALEKQLGPVQDDAGAPVGEISAYFVNKFRFNPEAVVFSSTGDNPATLISLPLRSNDAIVSLGTSTTFLMSTPHYKPDPSYHFMKHPTTEGLYMFMLCYKNGGLAREKVRDVLNNDQSKSWEKFNELVVNSPMLNRRPGEESLFNLGLFFPLPEIVPNVNAGIYRYTWDSSSGGLQRTSTQSTGVYAPYEARTILESQFLSMRLRSRNLVSQSSAHSENPPQPSKIYLVGGGSLNPAITQLCTEVLGGIEGVYRLDIGSNACALGAAYKAAWAGQRSSGESFEDFVSKRWKEDGFVKKIADGYQPGVWETYGKALNGYEAMEKDILKIAGVGT